jgi:AraC-like DNA-binding protein
MYSALTIVHSGHLVDAHTKLRTPGVTLSGTMSRVAAREYVGMPETTVVVFKPGRLTDLCRLPASDLTDRWAGMETILSRRDQIDIADRMASQPTLARQIMVLEQLLERRFGASTPSDAEALALAVRAAVWRLPHMKVRELADEFGWTPRRLERRFQHTFGVTPKMLMRLARLQLALFQLQRRNLAAAGHLAAVAKAAGYADQAHLARETRQLAGLAPTQLAEALRTAGSSAWAYSVPQDSLQPLEGANTCDPSPGSSGRCAAGC